MINFNGNGDKIRYDTRRVTRGETKRQATRNENDHTLKCGENMFTDNLRLTLNYISVALSSLTNRRRQEYIL